MVEANYDIWDRFEKTLSTPQGIAMTWNLFRIHNRYLRPPCPLVVQERNQSSAQEGRDNCSDEMRSLANVYRILRSRKQKTIN